MNTSYYFNNPAEFFEEACLLGNGFQGATVYGGADTERILLNNDTVYSGHPRTEEEKVPEDLYKKWQAARDCMLKGDYKECRRILTMEFNQGTSHKYLPMGNVYLDFGHNSVSNYKRSLDFEKAVSVVEYDFDGIHYIRNCFVPYKEDCVVLRLTADRRGSISFKLRFETELKTLDTLDGNGYYIYRGMCPYDHDRTIQGKQDPVYVYPESEGETISFAELIKPVINGGTVSFDDGVIAVEGADEVVLYMFSKTSYRDPYNKPDLDATNAVKTVMADCSFDYEEIKKTHVYDFGSLFNRVQLNLGQEKAMDVSERIKSFDGTDTGLYELLFNFGRYLMISSSRKGSRAINLQGIWNSTMNPPWESTYTTNINLQMAYWPSFTANLGDMWEPFVEYIESMVPMGVETAQRMYGVRGLGFHSNSDIWAHAYPCGRGQLESEQWSPWNLCSGWLCEQLFDGYEYTLDKEYLKRIYPLMKEASLFYLDLLVEDTDGKLMLCPCSSPENRYYLGDDSFALARYTAIGQSIVKELFMHTAETAVILDEDDEFSSELASKADNLKWLEIGSDGRLLEWDKEYKEVDPNHRHTSHVYGLYPGTTISVDNTPDLADACKKSLETRGDDGTGWGLAWKINIWALLRDGNHAVRLLNNQLKFVDCRAGRDYRFGGSYSNLLDAHPPFQIDGNFGTVAAICNMLFQSERGKITLLPALPDICGNGSAKGLVAKGNVAVSIWWRKGKVVKAVLSSPVSQAVTVVANGKEHRVGLCADEECMIEFLV